MARKSESSIVSKCALVIDVMTSLPEPVTFAQIVRETGFVKSSCHRILSVLRSEDMVAYDEETRTYHIGERIQDWSRSHWRPTDLQKAAGNVMTALGNRSGLNIALSVLDRDAILYVRVVTMVPVRFASQAGDRAPIHSTAAGKVFLAHLPEKRLDRLLRTLKLEKYTEYTITDLESLSSQFPLTRKNGFAIARREEVLQVTGISAPVWNASDEVIASLSMWSVESEMGPDAVVECAPQIVAAAAEISKRLGHEPVRQSKIDEG